MFETLDQILWESFPQPAWNKSDSVPRKLRSLATCASADDARDAYNGVLYALGNNHAGTYYPVVVAVLPFLGEIIERGSETAREMALDVLVDLTGSFEPELGFETVSMPDGSSTELKRLVLRGAQQLVPAVEAVAQSDEASPRARKLASEILLLVEEGASRYRA